MVRDPASTVKQQCTLETRAARRSRGLTRSLGTVRGVLGRRPVSSV